MSKAYGVTLRTLRFYEKKGLINPRRAGRLRFYDSNERKRLEMILLGKELGFSLAEIKEAIDSADWGDSVDFESLFPEQQILRQLKYLEQRREEIDRSITRLREKLGRR